MTVDKKKKIKGKNQKLIFLKIYFLEKNIAFLGKNIAFFNVYCKNVYKENNVDLFLLLLNTGGILLLLNRGFLLPSYESSETP